MFGRVYCLVVCLCGYWVFCCNVCVGFDKFLLGLGCLVCNIDGNYVLFLVLCWLLFYCVGY